MTREIPDFAQRQFIEDLFAIMREEAFPDPFFDAARSGEMSRAGVKAWILQAAIVVREFPRFISATHANCPHRDAQQLLAENIWEEHGRGDAERDHYNLIKRMAESVGATSEEIDGATPIDATRDYIDYCLRITRDEDFIVGMVAIGIGIEYYMPVFFGSLSEALCSNYNLARSDLESLMLHLTENKDHARRAVEIVRKYADSREIKERACESLREMISLKRRFAESLYSYCQQAETV
jgi:pyrroloquinoline-quinone synthase